MVELEDVYAALRRVIDPEVGLNIVDLGLVYGVDIHAGNVRVEMTLTTEGCPMSVSLPRAVERAVALVPGVAEVEVALTYQPPWTPERISPEGRKALGWLV
jgi:metal-sulfur cluster biosynthetic enzyme